MIDQFNETKCYDCDGDEKMVECAIIFSKDTGNVLLHSKYGSFDPDLEVYTESIEKIKNIATKLEKGVFKQDLDQDFIASISAEKELSVALIFKSDIDKNELKSWEGVAKEIISGFEKYYATGDALKYPEFKKKLDEIIDWHLKEQSPIDKMKEALW